MSAKPFTATVRYGTDFYGSLFSDEEQATLESHTEPPLITFGVDRIIIAYDSADHVYAFPVERTHPATDEATWGRRFSDWLARNPRPMESL